MQEARVTIVGAYGRGNLGDDLLMLATTDALRGICPPSAILVLTQTPRRYVRAWGHQCRFQERRQTGGPLRTDLLVYGGGTQFFSFPGSSQAEAEASSLRRLLGRARRALTRPSGLARAFRTMCDQLNRVRASSAAAVGVGVGPFVPGCAQESTARARLGACGYVAVRDRASLACCRSWGIGAAVLRADPCYGSWLEPVLRAAGRGADMRRGRRVAVVVRAWPHSDVGSAYLAPLWDAVEQLRGRNVLVDYVAFNAGFDQQVVSQLRRSGERVLVWRPESDELGRFLAELARHEVVVSARAHGAILAAGMGIPAVCIEVEPKLKLMCRQLGAGARLWSAPFEPDALVGAVEELLGAPDRNGSALADRVAQLRWMADQLRREFRRYAAGALASSGERLATGRGA